MKKTILGAFTAFALLSVAKGATTINAFNYVLGAGGYAQQILVDGTTKAPFGGAATGSVLIGTFSNPTGLGTATSVTLADFGWSLFATQTFNLSGNQPGLFGGAGPGGVSGATGNLPTTATGAFVGNAIYAVIPNGLGEFIIINSGKNFAAELEGVGGAAVSFGTKDGISTLVRGNIVAGGTNGLAGQAATFNQTDALTFGAAIPEPSAALLGAIGALGLLRRRRN